MVGRGDGWGEDSEEGERDGTPLFSQIRKRLSSIRCVSYVICIICGPPPSPSYGIAVMVAMVVAGFTVAATLVR